MKPTNWSTGWHSNEVWYADAVVVRMKLALAGEKAVVMTSQVYDLVMI
ncbi:MAG: hypothetical protein WBL67_08565 [Nitrososphaeraceae archaeon]